MNFRPNVNFSFAFDQLKDAMKRAEVEREKNTLTSFASAHGILYGAVDGIINFVEEQNDLPTNLFQQSERGKEIDNEIENELIN